MNLCFEWIELLRAFNAEGVRYLVVGGHAYTMHVEPRYTGDLDLWIEPTLENAQRIWRALTKYGAPLNKVTMSDFTNPDVVFQMGTIPNRVDILMGISAISFPQAWKCRVGAKLGGVPVWLISRSHLIRNKLAAGRDQDLVDVKRLKQWATRPKKTKKRRKK
jgi:hypothetical protein